MIEKTIRTTHGKLTVKMPTSLDEITLGQLMEMQQKDKLGDLDAISILSGVPKESLATVRSMDDFAVFGEHILLLSNQVKYLYESDVIPNKIKFDINGRQVMVRVMNNLSIEPAGAFLAARDIIADEIGSHINLYSEEDWQEYFQPSLTACCQVLAHYFFCRATGKMYDEYAVEEFCEEIKKLRVTEALPIAKHFFTCYPVLSKPGTGFFQRLLRYWRKRLASARSKSLNISIPSIPWPAAI